MAKKCFRCRGAIAYVLLPRYPITTLDDDVILVLELPAQRCTQCGQLFFTAEVTEILDALRRGEVVPPRRKLTIPAFKVPAHLREAARAEPVVQESPSP